MSWNFKNTYTELPNIYYSNVKPDKHKNPKLILFNKELADELNLNINSNDRDICDFLLGYKIFFSRCGCRVGCGPCGARRGRRHGRLHLGDAAVAQRLPQAPLQQLPLASPRRAASQGPVPPRGSVALLGSGDGSAPGRGTAR